MQSAVLKLALALIGIAATLSACTQASLHQGKAAETAPTSDAPSIGTKLKNPFSSERKERLLNSLPKGPFATSTQAKGVEADLAEEEARSEYGLVNSLPEAERYLNSLYAKVKDATQFENIPGHVYLLPSESLEARSTADGNVYMTLPWVFDATEEGELVALLAHELGHVILRHHDSDAWGKMLYSMREIAGTLATVGAAIKAAENNQQSATIDPKTKNSLRKLEYFAILVDQGINPAWGRTQELEADLISIDLTQKLGYAYENSFQPFIEALMQDEKEQAKAAIAQRALVQAEIDQLSKSGRSDEALNKAWKVLGGDIVKQLTDTHPDSKVRQTEAIIYFDKFYGNKGATGAYRNRLANTKSILTWREAYRKVFAAKVDMDKGNNAAAKKNLAAVLRPGAPAEFEPMPNTMYWRLLYQEAGNDKQAIARSEQFLEKSLKAKKPVYKTYTNLAAVELDMANASGNPAEAFKHRGMARQWVEAGLQKFHRPGFLLPQALRTAKQVGDSVWVAQLMTECSLNNSPYASACRKAIQ